jgi:predicted Zn-dependent protease
LAQGRKSQADALLDTLLRQNQINSDTLLRAGFVFAEKGLYSEAALAFERCAREYPQLFEAQYDFALAELACGRYAEALRTINAARAASERDRLRRLYLRGKVENAEGRLRQARTDLAAAFAGDPENEDYALDLGLFYLLHHTYPAAVNVFAQARTFHSQSLFAGLGLALAEYFSGRTSNCIQACKQVLAQQPAFSPARVLLAFAFYMQGNFKDAAAAAREGLGSPGLHPYVDYIDVASLLKLGSRDYSRMLAEIRTAEQQIPACSLCYLAQSRIDEARGNRERAIRDLQQAVGLDSEFADAWYRLAVLYGQAGQDVKAARARALFRVLKATKAERQKEMLQGAFIRSLSKEE